MADFLKYGSTGPKVKGLQQLLNNNVYRKPRRLLQLDGEFGPLTAASVNGTKFWLGYPKENIQPVAGDKLFSLLENKEPLSDAYKAKRKERQQNIIDNAGKQKDTDKMRLQALAVIKGELGTLEQPNNSNHIKYNTYWNWGPVAYCVIGVSWAWLKVGSKAFVKGSRWAGCTQMLADARGTEKGLHLTSEPDPGCPGVIDLYGDANPDHCITFVKDNGNGTCETYEFNTSKDGTYIQGVWNKTRPMKDCWFFEIEY
jgi:hypothetical protein